MLPFDGQPDRVWTPFTRARKMIPLFKFVVQDDVMLEQSFLSAFLRIRVRTSVRQERADDSQSLATF